MATADHRIEALAREYERAKTQLPPGAADRMAAAESLALAAGSARCWLNLAFEHFSGYRFGHAHAALAETLKLDPHALPAHWLRFQLPDTPAPASAEHANAFRQRWEAGLALFEGLDYSQPTVRQQVWGCVGSATAFYRHYVDEDCVVAQRRYGALVHRMMAALDPGEAPRAPATGRRRILFVSPYLYQHTVARLFVPLIEQLDTERLAVDLIHLGAENDAMTARVRSAGTFHGDIRDAPTLRRRVAALAPDVIVYLDLGMHPATLALAGLRLAPVQCTLWGHPVTTGLPTLDYFLSPDAMEPDDAVAHYSESLVRLPSFGHGLELEARQIDSRSDGNAIEFLCAQSVYKLMPEQDVLFARILAAVPGSRLNLVPHPEPHVRDWLRERMRPAMSALGVDADSRIVMHGYGSLAQFRQLADRCDINLDSIGWSGGMSSIDLLQAGLPTVTVPGRFMRGRQTASLLQRLGLGDLVADDVSAWVDLAVALARSPERRAEVRDRLRRRAAQLAGSAAVAGALEHFLLSCEPNHRQATLDPRGAEAPIAR